VKLVSELETMADKERSFLFDLLSTQSVIAGVVLLVMCWLVLRYITTGRKRRVSDYVKKFDPVDVSIGHGDDNT